MTRLAAALCALVLLVASALALSWWASAADREAVGGFDGPACGRCM